MFIACSHIIFTSGILFQFRATAFMRAIKKPFTILKKVQTSGGAFSHSQSEEERQPFKENPERVAQIPETGLISLIFTECC
jgi:hypothetical protein